VTAGLPEAIEALDTRHDRRSFSCGDSELDEYLRRFARQHAAAKVSRTYVAANGATILGFYSLAMSAIRKDQLPAVHQSRFPNFPLPVARLARLAVDQRHQRQGLGELLMADALSRCLRLSEEIGMVGVVVDTKHEGARRYYERFEFERFPDCPLTLWLPTAAIARL
jgi:GNAT superfamily N-acetyltransferase